MKLKRFWKWICGDWWEVRRCCWPYPEGYGTYNPARRTILDTGLTREQAVKICAELNSKYHPTNHSPRKAER